MNRIICLTAIAALLLLVVTGCSASESIDTDAIVFIAEGSPVDGPFSMEVEDESVLELRLPVDGEAELAVHSDADGLRAEVEGRDLHLTALLPGDYAVRIDIVAEGYSDATLTYPVTVAAHAMELTVKNGGDTVDIDRGMAVYPGADMTFDLEAAEGAVFHVETGDADVARAEVAGDRFTLYGVFPGETTLTITAERDLFEPVVKTVAIEVPLTAAAMSLNPSEVSLDVGTARTLSMVSQTGGNVTCDYDATGISVELTDQGLMVRGLKAGRYTLTATCEAHGYTAGSAQAVVTVTEPSIELSVGSSVSLRAGESQRLAVQVTPADAEITLQVTGAVTASYADGALTVQGTAKGTGSVVVTAGKEGYRSASRAVSATVLAALPNVDTTTYATIAQQVITYTNNERRAAGLPALEHIPIIDIPATVRARESASLWSHTRPDGREWLTVFDDCDIYYYGRGENLFAGNVLDAQIAVDTFMDSPLHRENILKPEYTGIGIGVYAYGGEYFICQLFVHDR